MFSLDELKQIKNQYFYDPNKGKIKLQFHARGDSSVKKPEELNQDEKNKIISALYEYNIVREIARGNGIAGERTEEDVLNEIQTKVYNEILTPGEKSVKAFISMVGNPRDLIMMDIAHPKKEKRQMADIYFNYILSENGKKATNLQRSIVGGLSYTISYDVEDLRKNHNFMKYLDPNSPEYTKPQKKLNLTPEQLAKRKAIVERLITDYRMMETDEWYKTRAEKEETDMQRIAYIVNNNKLFDSQIKGPGLFRLLIAAQNLSLDGEKDFLEEMLKQPAVCSALLELKESRQVNNIHTQAQKNKQNAKINENGILEGRSLTHGEKSIRDANQLISEHPNAVSVAREKLSEKNTFLIKYGDTEAMKKARLIEVVAKSQGKNITRTTDKDGNRLLQVDDVQQLQAS